jgi:hypothetical protein
VPESCGVYYGGHAEGNVLAEDVELLLLLSLIRRSGNS